MAARPPRDDGDSDPEAVEFGIAALDARLDRADVDFPAQRADLQRRLGETSVPYDASGNEVDLATVLSRVDRGRFEDEQELLNALHPVFETLRTERSRSVVGQVRALLPF
jgi:hypothetical protein